MTENNRLKGKIASIPDYAFLGVILVVCLLYRIYYFGFLNPGMVQYNSDSVSYFYAVDLFRGGVDLYRTPLYPYVIKFFQYVSGDHLVRNLIFFQQALSFLSIIPFYFVSKRVIGNVYVGMIATLFYGCWHPILIQNVHLNPESLCFAGSVFMLSLLVRFLEKPKRSAALAIGIFPFFLIMLKPTYLILIAVMLLFLLCRFFLLRDERKILYWGLLGLCVTAAGVLGYCGMNKKFNGQFVLSNIALNNTIAHLSISGAYEYGKDEEFMAVIDRTRHINYYAAPFSINNHFIDNYKRCYRNFPKDLPPTEDMIFCSVFPDRVNYSPERIIRFISHARCTVVYVKYMAQRAFDIIVAAYGNLFLLLALQSVLIMVAAVKYKKIAWAQSFCIVFVLGQFFSIWLAGLDDMNRHLMPSYPFLIQIAGSFAVNIGLFLSKNKLSSKSDNAAF
ncbi:MAG: glycosyltransferase family 39 protein [Deltaproteobacteria bacterium]|nr:glycosyltransferase family 39 protein [Deltaproteobacteria bacterium]